jgi:hypothetical protein
MADGQWKMENGKNLSIFAISHLPFSIRPVFQRPDKEDGLP